MRKITAVLTICICLTVLIIAGFPGLGDAATIYGCYGKLAGVMRIVSGAGQCTRLENPISWNTVGPQGPAGPPGSGGIVAQVCPVGQVVAGFDGNGNIICVPRGRPLPPVLTGVMGPFFDLGQLICNDPFLGPQVENCQQVLGFFNQLARYEVSGKAEPRTGLTFYLSGDCSGDVYALRDQLSQLCEDHLGNACIFLIPIIETTFFQVEPSPSGDSTAILVTVDPGATVSATTAQAMEEKSDCSAPLTLP